MNNKELERYLQPYNVGSARIIVCAIDRLPKKLKPGKKYCFIINLSKADDVGSHWVSLYVDKALKASYMDSYGFKPRSWYLTKFIKENCKHVNYSTRQLQQLTSKVCGMYAACFIIHMVKGGTLRSFIDKFSKNLLLNDIFIIKNYNYYLRNNNI